MDNSSLIKSPISEELEDFKKLFESTLSSSNLLLNSVIAHIRQKNGKMMRPILVLLAAKLFGKVCPATLHAAVALELLHNASLVHDDVVDESTERRGQLSVNAIFNNKVAVLAGDYLLATALVQVGMTRNHDIIDIVSCLGQVASFVSTTITPAAFQRQQSPFLRGSLFRRYPQEDGRALCSLYEGGRSLGGSQR